MVQSPVFSYVNFRVTVIVIITKFINRSVLTSIPPTLESSPSSLDPQQPLGRRVHSWTFQFVCLIQKNCPCKFYAQWKVCVRFVNQLYSRFTFSVKMLKAVLPTLLQLYTDYKFHLSKSTFTNLYVQWKGCVKFVNQLYADLHKIPVSVNLNSGILS